jgi:hypothetical protein
MHYPIVYKIKKEWNRKKNSNIINCFKKSFQILKDIIEKINQFKQLAKQKTKKQKPNNEQ